MTTDSTPPNNAASPPGPPPVGAGAALPAGQQANSFWPITDQVRQTSIDQMIAMMDDPKIPHRAKIGIFKVFLTAQQQNQNLLLGKVPGCTNVNIGVMGGGNAQMHVYLPHNSREAWQGAIEHDPEYLEYLQNKRLAELGREIGAGRGMPDAGLYPPPSNIINSTAVGSRPVRIEPTADLSPENGDIGPADTGTPEDPQVDEPDPLLLPDSRDLARPPAFLPVIGPPMVRKPEANPAENTEPPEGGAESGCEMEGTNDAR